MKFIKTLLFVLSINLLQADEFLFEPPKNFTLSPKYIALHHPVKTDSVAAQAFFDQGLTFLYAFNHEAAYWSFIKATEEDPNMAMGYWGRALVLGANINIDIVPKRAKIAYETVQKALELSKNSPDVEKAYINALKERYTNDPNVKGGELAKNYYEAMKKLNATYPDDPDSGALFAESILNLSPWDQWDKDGKPKDRTTEALKTLESVLKAYPMHLGANHYYIHAVEASKNPSQALVSAERLKTLLPSSGHILHMPSHIYLLVGDYEQAVLTNLRAIAADREYVREFGMVGTYPVHYLSHNYHFLSQAYSMQGNYDGAMDAANGLLKLYLPHYTKMPELEQYASTRMFVNLRFHKWKELLEMPEPPKEALITNTLWHFGRSAAFASIGNFTEASKEQKLFLEGKSKIAASSKYGFNDAANIMKLAEYFLEGKLAESQGQLEKAIEAYKKAIVQQDSLGYDEPPNWLFSIRDNLGGLLLKEKRFKEAEDIFRDDLKQHPRSGRSLFGLKTSLEGQGRMADYYFVNDAFEEAWRFSDTDLNLNNL